VVPPCDKGAMPSACHCACSSLRSSAGLGSEAHATPLHSTASAPAILQLAAGIRRARAALVRRPKAGAAQG
jgi:hypothetical protein